MLNRIVQNMGLLSVNSSSTFFKCLSSFASYVFFSYSIIICTSPVLLRAQVKVFCFLLCFLKKMNLSSSKIYFSLHLCDSPLLQMRTARQASATTQDMESQLILLTSLAEIHKAPASGNQCQQPRLTLVWPLFMVTLSLSPLSSLRQCVFFCLLASVMMGYRGC